MDVMNIVSAVVVLAVMGAVFGLILAVASKVFEVKKDPREEEILGHLAGANCGGCGFAGCGACAAAIVEGKAPVTACPRRRRERRCHRRHHGHGGSLRRAQGGLRPL